MTPRPNVEEQRRSEIIDAALRCFARDGFGKTSMDAIAQEAGLSKALIYYYYKSKEEVFEAGFDALILGMTEAFVSGGREGTPSERLRELTKLTIDLGDASAELFGMMLECWALSRRQDSMLSRLRGAFVQMRRAIARILEDGVAIGEFAPMDTEQVAAAILASLDGLWAHWVLDPGAMDPGKATASLVEFLIDGMVKRA